VDTDGLLLGVLVHAADIQDADSLGELLKRIKPLYNWLRVVFADGIYNRLTAMLACFLFGLTLIIVRRPAGSTGFVVQPRRWVVTACTILPGRTSSGLKRSGVASYASWGLPAARLG
jgi:putative transposase